ncbi:MAG: hypothetical protein C5B51_06920 [Terriglobia bacterium]|nr:MAG: hypothetical protein C5B51_06920 [Terriglobia bacterium]
MRPEFLRNFRTSARWALPLIAAAVAITTLAQTGAVTDKDVRPILEKKCFQCHGDNLRMGNLDLRSRESMLQGGSAGPALVPGRAAESLLYQRVTGQSTPRMPMAPQPILTDSEVAILKRWIDEGAKWDSASPAVSAAPGDKAGASYAEYKERVITDEMRHWWAFQKPVRNTPPAVMPERWSKNPIDMFVKASMDANSLTPAPQADRATLIRRAYLDLIGLLPSPAEVDTFVSDPSPRAYEDLVERLLASSHYGERWGRFWLDVVRFAESSGYEHDRTLNTAWRYRDYVIKSLNDDKPYNRFVIEQLAGDELDPPTEESLVATAYYRVGPRVRFREKDNPYYRYDYLDDIIRTTFGGFMGLSVQCARCHDHKFDPITRMDYYRSVAMFFGHVNYDHLLVPKKDADEWAAATKEILRQIAPLKKEIAQIEAPYKRKQFEETVKKLPEDVQLAIKTPVEQRTAGQKLLAAQFESGLDVDPDANADDDLAKIVLAATDDNFYHYSPPSEAQGSQRRGLKLSDADEQKRKELQNRITELQKKMPKAPPGVEGVRDGDYRLAPDGPGDVPLPGKSRAEYGVKCCYLPEPGQEYHVPDVHFGANGLNLEEDVKGPVVQPGFLQVLVNGTPPPLADPPKRTDYVSSGRRRALAEWIASPENPLTARVMVNRLWYWHFGTGIVATPGTFGKMGAPPSHPELLDWLATEFIRQGWSIKQIQRLIMNSETYKMSSRFYNADDVGKDPTDVYLWRYPVRRLEGEAIRDIVLSASGKINFQAGGPSFFPAIPLSVRVGYANGRWDLTKEEPATWRRSVYSYWKRGMKVPMFDVHDQPDQNFTAERRNISTVPTQALMLLNDEFTLLQSRLLAERVMQEAGSDLPTQVKLLYKIALSRQPTERELRDDLEFVNREQAAQAGNSEGTYLRAMSRLAHVMINSNEFVYIN